jgi:enamine deaminase RidA (YjgF/YER057c/UK114 family)
MNPTILLAEDDFTLEFRTIHDLTPLSGNSPLPDVIGSNGYVLQERIILPPNLADKKAGFSAQTIAPLRCNAPLVLIGHPGLPVQYSSMIVRPKQGQSRVEKHDAAIKVAADEMDLLFSAPLFSEKEKTVGSFSSAFDRTGKVLAACGMDETAIARTWLFLDDILKDYETLNQARKIYFDRWHSPDRHFMPASTGIEGHVVDLKPLTVQISAFSGKRLAIRQQASPLQNEATDYGKLFSRSVVVELPRCRLVYISGTAAINKAGISMHAGNFEKQLRFTLEILSAILSEVNGNFSHMAQATVYLKKHEDFNACLPILEGAGFPRTRTMFLTDTPVCRDDLLCEIELTAVTENG